MIFIILTALILIYLFSIPNIRRTKFGRKVVLTLRIIIVVAAPILIALLFAETYNTYPREYWITKGIFWIVVLSCLSAYGLCNRQHLSNLERAIYKVLFFLPLVFLVFLLVPFIGIGCGLIFYVKFIGDNKFVLYSDNQIRIEQPYIRFLGPDPQPILYVKNKLTSFQDTTLPFRYHEETDKIEVTKQGNSSYTILLKSPDNWQVPDGIDTFYYHLQHKNKFD